MPTRTPPALKLLALAMMTAAGTTAAQAADAIYFGGPIITMDESGLYVEAVATEGDRIVATGRFSRIRQLADDDTRMVDLEGHTMLPGFIDGHSHFFTSGMLRNSVVDLNPPPIGDVQSMERLIEKLRAAIPADAGAGTVIAGFGYDDTLLAENRHPTRADLDQVSTEFPVIITHVSGHLGVGNTKALERAGVTPDTPNPDGGRIARDADGEATGLMEGNAGLLLRALLPTPGETDVASAYETASRMWAERGVTTASDNFTSPAQVGQALAAVNTGQLRVRLNYWPRVRTAEAVRAFPGKRSGTDLSGGRRMLTQGPVKFTIDGSPQGYTAHFSQPYMTLRPEDPEGYRGFPYWDDRDAFFDIVETLHRDGYQMTIHGNGDQGIQDVIDAYASAQRAFPREDMRHGIIHAQFSRPDQLRQMAALDLSPSFFIGHTYYWGDRHKNVFFGKHRAEHMSPLRGAAENGLRYSIHTDTPVTPIDPIQMLWSAVNRVSTGGDVIGAQQRVGALQALRALTIDVAWQFHEEDMKGSIEPGKLADFVVLSDDPLSVAHNDPDALRDLVVLRTVVGGETVFRGETRSVVATPQ